MANFNNNSNQFNADMFETYPKFIGHFDYETFKEVNRETIWYSVSTKDFSLEFFFENFYDDDVQIQWDFLNKYCVHLRKEFVNYYLSKWAEEENWENEYKSAKAELDSYNQNSDLAEMFEYDDKFIHEVNSKIESYGTYTFRELMDEYKFYLKDEQFNDVISRKDSLNLVVQEILYRRDKGILTPFQIAQLPVSLLFRK